MRDELFLKNNLQSAIQFHQTVRKVLHLHFHLYTNDVKFIDTKQFQFELCINRSCTKLICKFHVVKNDSSTQEIPFGFHVFGEMFGLMHFCQKYIKFALIHYQIFNIVATKNGLFSFIDNEMIENIFILADQLTAH